MFLGIGVNEKYSHIVFLIPFWQCDKSFRPCRTKPSDIDVNMWLFYEIRISSSTYELGLPLLNDYLDFAELFSQISRANNWLHKEEQHDSQ